MNLPGRCGPRERRIALWFIVGFSAVFVLLHVLSFALAIDDSTSHPGQSGQLVDEDSGWDSTLAEVVASEHPLWDGTLPLRAIDAESTEHNDGTRVPLASATVSATARLSIRKVVPLVVPPGYPITATLIVSNTSEVTATNLMITDTIPVGATYVAGGTLLHGEVQWYVDLLPPRQQVSMHYVVTATQTITGSFCGARSNETATRRRYSLPTSISPFYHDVSLAVGIDVPTSDTFGPAVGDFDGDGWLDAIYMNHWQTRSWLYHNQYPTGFTRFKVVRGVLPEGPGSAWLRDPHGVACGDYNNDGWPDLFFSTGRAAGQVDNTDALMQNMGGLRFQDVTTATGTANLAGRARTPTWVDYNRDGWLDLAIGNYNTPNVTYRNNGDGTFADTSNRTGLTDTSANRMVWFDYNGDGWPDVLTTAPLSLFRNDGNGRFTDVSRQALAVSQRRRITTLAHGDYDNDGDEDVFVGSAFEGYSMLLENGGAGVLREVAGSFGPFEPGNPEKYWIAGFGAAWADMDNDGDLDLLVLDRRRLWLFENQGGQLAITDEVTLPVSSLWLGDLDVGDYDNDGSLDLFLATQEQNRLWRNLRRGNNWLKLRLAGTVSNRSGFGTKIRVSTADQQIFREYTGDANVMYSSGCGPVHIGVGSATTATIEIVWPSGITQTVQADGVNRVMAIREPLQASTSSPNTAGQVTVLRVSPLASRSVSYTWNLGDGREAAGTVVEHVYQTAGIYTAVVTAAGDRGILTATTTVHIEAAATPIPTTTATSTPTSTSTSMPTLLPLATATATTIPTRNGIFLPVVIIK